LGRALAPVELSIAAWRSFVQARASFEDLQSLLRETPAESQAIELPAPEGRIQVEGVSFIPPGAEKPVLRNLNFQVEPGEALVIIGPSAAGKSTLCRLLVGVWTPTVGAVRLDAADVTQWDRVEFGKYVGYLPQDVELFTGSVRQNIARMGEATDAEVVEAAQLADVHEMILRLPDGYDTYVGAGGAALSAGQRQRVGLARALLRNPKVVVLDEPGASLDRQGEVALLRALNEFKKRGSTVIVVAHHANMLEGADKILVIQEGMVKSFGPKNDVLSQLKGSPQDNPQRGDGKIQLAPEPGQKG
jgi:PrtD family type I secretion system ABC transporter